MLNSVLVTNEDHTEVQTIKNDFFDISFVSSKKRQAKKNEDGMAIIFGKERLLLAIADGMGGHPHGELAAEQALRQFMLLEKHKDKPNFLANEIIATLTESNKSVLQIPNSGTTLLIVEILSKNAAYYLVGDSKMVLLDKNGSTKVEARGHSYYDLVKEADVEKQLVESNDYLQNTLSSCLGSEFFRIESCSPFKINKSDILIAGSDGLFDTVDINKTLSKGFKSPQEACQTLLDKTTVEMYHASKDHKHDDITICAIKRL